MEHKKLISRIAQLRERTGLTQLELAQLLEVTESTIANYEKGRSGLEGIERTAKLCKIFNCNPEDLIKIEYVSDLESVEVRRKGRSLAELRKLLGTDEPAPSTINDVHTTESSKLGPHK